MSSNNTLYFIFKKKEALSSIVRIINKDKPGFPKVEQSSL